MSKGSGAEKRTVKRRAPIREKKPRRRASKEKVVEKKELQETIVAKIFSRSKKRAGRGFSISELREAGFDIQKARSLKIYIDRRRRSLYKENVDALKSLIR